VSALVIGNVASPPIFFAAMLLWGFSWWVVVPAVFQLLAARSLTPAERIGDAQALMAVGRVFGPILGGIAVAGESFGRLSVTGASVMFAGALIVVAVEMARRRAHAV
jgi:DHA1 family inner membrane transport protein